MNPCKFLTFFSLALCLPLALAGASPSLNIDLKLESTADHKGASTKTQSRKLTVEIANYANEDVPNLKVKWWIYGHDMKDHNKLVIIEEGESKVAVPARKTVEVVSPEVKITDTREHKVSSRKGRGKKSRSSTKTVPASGQEYYGYAVEVYSGDTRIEAEYSKPSIKEELDPR